MPGAQDLARAPALAKVSKALKKLSESNINLFSILPQTFKGFLKTIQKTFENLSTALHKSVKHL